MKCEKVGDERERLDYFLLCTPYTISTVLAD